MIDRTLDWFRLEALIADLNRTGGTKEDQIIPVLDPELSQFRRWSNLAAEVGG